MQFPPPPLQNVLHLIASRYTDYKWQHVPLWGNELLVGRTSPERAHGLWDSQLIGLPVPIYSISAVSPVASTWQVQWHNFHIKCHHNPVVGSRLQICCRLEGQTWPPQTRLSSLTRTVQIETAAMESITIISVNSLWRNRNVRMQTPQRALPINFPTTEATDTAVHLLYSFSQYWLSFVASRRRFNGQLATLILPIT